MHLTQSDCCLHTMFISLIVWIYHLCHKLAHAQQGDASTMSSLAGAASQAPGPAALKAQQSEELEGMFDGDRATHNNRLLSSQTEASSKAKAGSGRRGRTTEGSIPEVRPGSCVP